MSDVEKRLGEGRQVRKNERKNERKRKKERTGY